MPYSPTGSAVLPGSEKPARPMDTPPCASACAVRSMDWRTVQEVGGLPVHTSSSRYTRVHCAKAGLTQAGLAAEPSLRRTTVMLPAAKVVGGM